MKNKNQILKYNLILNFLLTLFQILTITGLVVKFFNFSYFLYAIILCSIIGIVLNINLKIYHLNNKSDSRVVEYNLFTMFMSIIAFVTLNFVVSITVIIICLFVTILTSCNIIFSSLMLKHSKK